MLRIVLTVVTLFLIYLIFVVGLPLVTDYFLGKKNNYIPLVCQNRINTISISVISISSTLIFWGAFWIGDFIVFCLSLLFLYVSITSIYFINGITKKSRKDDKYVK